MPPVSPRLKLCEVARTLGLRFSRNRLAVAHAEEVVVEDFSRFVRRQRASEAVVQSAGNFLLAHRGRGGHARPLRRYNCILPLGAQATIARTFFHTWR